MANVYEYIIDVIDAKAKSSLKDIAKGAGIVENKFDKLSKAAGLGMKKTANSVTHAKKSVGGLQNKVQKLANIGAWSKSRKKVTRYNSEIKKTQKEVDKLSGKQNSMFSGLSGSIAGIVGVGAGIAIFKSIASAGMEMEQTRVSFETFLGSAAAGNKVIAELQEFSNVTPFEPEQVLKAGKSLLAFGTDAKDLIPVLKNIGDISAATGKDFNELSTIYGKAKIAGTLYAEDINQLVEAGVPIIGEFAKQLGVSNDQVKKMASEGKLKFGHLEKAFQNLTGEGGKFQDLMKKQSKTVGGRMSTLVGIVKNIGIEMGEALLPVIGNFVDGLQFLLGWVRTNISNLKAVFQPVIDIFSSMFSQLSGLGEKLGFVGSKGDMLKTVFNAIGNAISFLSPILKVIVDTFTLVITKIAEVVGAVVSFIQGSERAQKFLMGYGTAVISVFKSMGNAAQSILGGIGDLLIGVFTGNMDKIKEGLSGLSSGLMEGNPIAQGITAAKGFSKGYEKGFKGTDFFKKKPKLALLQGGTEDSTTNNLNTSAGLPAKEDTKENGINEIAGKGGRQINLTVNLGKFLDDINIYPSTINEGIQDVESELKSMFIRILNGGLHAATQ